MKIKKIVSLIIATLMFSVASYADYLEGIVVSDCSSSNAATGVNLAADLVDLGESLRTVYVVSEDGTKGNMIKLAHPYGNYLKRGDKVRINMDDTSISAVEVLSHGNDLPIRRKHISELTSDDCYTLVALQGVEFRKKEGGYLNIDERFVQKTSLNSYLALEGLDGFSPAREFVDTWATMLVDDEGNHIYCLINSTCEWRRNNMGVPKGVGELLGIIVPADLPRYGASLGEFAIRPMFESDFHIPKPESTSYVTVCAWNYDFNKYVEMNCLESGKVRFPKPGQVVGDKILAESGEGFLWTDTGASITFANETNARHSCDGWKDARNTGSRSYSAVRLDCKSGDWYRTKNDYNGLYVKASLKNVSEAKSLHFNFSFVASLDNSTYAEKFPVDWQVSYSVDGENFIPVEHPILLRASCFTNIRHNKLPAVVHTGCAPGFTEHRIDLPLELIGKDVTIKLSPCSERTATLPESFDGPCCEGKIKDDKESDMILRFGDISITYIP